MLLPGLLPPDGAVQLVAASHAAAKLCSFRRPWPYIFANRPSDERTSSFSLCLSRISCLR